MPDKKCRCGPGTRTVPLKEAVGMALSHDITEIRPGQFKGRAFKKGHVIREEDISRLQRLGKEHVYVIEVPEDGLHEDEAASVLAAALMGEGVTAGGEPREGKINIIAARDGLLKINRRALLEFNMPGEVICATLHDNTVVKRGRLVGGTRAIPLVAKKAAVEKAVETACAAGGIISVKRMRAPRAGVVITGGEVSSGRIRDAFAPVIRKKVEELGGSITAVYFAPDDEAAIEGRLRELLASGADLLILTGGMSVDPDDVTRFAVQNLGAVDMAYGAAALPGSMVLVAYLGSVPVIGVPACGIYHRRTVFDLLLPRILAGEKIGRKELAELGHGGLCLDCPECRYPACPFGK